MATSVLNLIKQHKGFENQRKVQIYKAKQSPQKTKNKSKIHKYNTKIANSVYIQTGGHNTTATTQNTEKIVRVTHRVLLRHG